MSTPEEWGAVAVTDGPQEWGAIKVSDGSPESWGALPVDDPASRIQKRALLKKEKSNLEKQPDPSTLGQIPSAVMDMMKGDSEAKTEPGGILKQVGIGAREGFYRLGEAGNKALEVLASTASPVLEEQFGGAAQVARREAERAASEGARTQGPDIARHLSSAAVSVLPSVAAAPAGLGAAAAAAGVQSFGSTASQAEQSYVQQGDRPDVAKAKAVIPAFASGVATGLTTKGFGNTGVENWSRAVRSGSFKEAVKDVAKHTGMEASEEYIDQLAQGATERLTYNPNLTFKEAILDATAAGAMGGVLGGAMTGIGKIATPKESSQTTAVVESTAPILPSAAKALAQTESQLSGKSPTEVESEKIISEETKPEIQPTAYAESLPQNPQQVPETGRQQEVLPEESSPDLQLSGEEIRTPTSDEEIPLTEEERLDREFKDVLDQQRKLGVTPGASSVARSARLANTAYRWAKKNAAAGWQRYFTSRGDLPQPVFDERVKRDGFAQQQDAKIRYAVRDFHNAVRDVYKIGRGEEFIMGLQSVPPQDIERMSAALKGEIPIAALDERLQGPIQKMRDDIDALSRHMLDEGLVDSNLAKTIEGNLGVYLTRSYKIFDDPEWSKNVPEETRNRARRFILDEMRRDNPGASIVEADTKLRNLLEDWRQEGMQKMLGRGKLGSKDLSLFMKRKDIAPEIRAVMGEYSNPVVNFARSMSKMARFIGDQRFLNAVRSKGLGKFLFEDGQNPPGFNTLLAAESSDVMAPLNGLRTSETIAEAFKQFSKRADRAGIAKAWFAVTAASKGAKTVGSLLTQLRNLSSQPIQNLFNGHYDWSEYGKGIKAIAADAALTNDKEWRAYYQNLARLGVVRESAKSNELREAFQEAGLRDLDYDELSAKTLARNMGKAVRKVALDAPSRIYGISDEIGKIVGFENEKARIKRIYPEWSPTQTEEEAAKRIRDTYPTYSMAPAAVKGFRNQPFFGPFVTFSAEMWRTAFNSLNQTRKEIWSSNPVERREGAKRLAGQMAVLGGGFGLAALSRAVIGIGKDEEDDLREFLPPWSENSQLIFTGKGDGKLSYVNGSYLNPYSYLSDPFIAVMANSEEGLQQAMLKSFQEFLRPFSNEQMLASKTMDVLRNTTQTGARVYNPQEDFESRFMDQVTHILGAVTPGTVERLFKRIIPAFHAQHSEFGRNLEPVREIASELTGVRAEQFDFKQGVFWKIRQFKKDEKDAENIFRSVLGTRRSSPEEMLQSYIESDKSRYRLHSQIYDNIQAAVRRGVPRRTVETMLKESGVSREEASNLSRGRYVPMKITEYSTKLARDNGKKIPMAEIRIYQRTAPTVLSGD